jgi:hypothetical protein
MRNARLSVGSRQLSVGGRQLSVDHFTNRLSVAWWIFL